MVHLSLSFSTSSPQPSSLAPTQPVNLSFPNKDLRWDGRGGHGGGRAMMKTEYNDIYAWKGHYKTHFFVEEILKISYWGLGRWLSG